MNSRPTPQNKELKSSILSMLLKNITVFLSIGGYLTSNPPSPENKCKKPSIVNTKDLKTLVKYILRN